MFAARSPMILVLLALTVFNAPLFADSDVYDFNLKLDTDTGLLDGRVTITYFNDSNEPLSELRFRLDMNLSNADSLLISSVKEAGGLELVWNYMPWSFATLSSDKGFLSVSLSEPVSPGETEAVEIGFRLSGKAFLGSALTILPDDPRHYLDAWYPKAMSYRSGEYSIDDDRLADYSLSLDLPANLVFASSGKIADDRVTTDGRRQVMLRAAGIRGFTFFGSVQWKKLQKTYGDIELSVCYYEQHENWAPRFLDAAADAIAFYEEEFGKFPTRHLDFNFRIIGHGTFTGCNVITIHMGNPRLEQQYRWLVAHEIAHQYFGSSINQGRDEINWVTYGLGLVMDRQYLRARKIEFNVHSYDWLMGSYPRVKKMGYDTSLSQRVSDLLSFEDERGWSSGWDWILLHGKTYSIVSILEDLIGEEEFSGIIKRIIVEKAGGMISPEEFFEYCEQAHGSELDWFFEDWIEGDATFDFSIDSVDKTNGVWDVTVSRKGSGSFPIELEAETESGRKIRARVNRESEIQKVRFNVAEGLKSVVIDPDGKYPEFELFDNCWPRKLDPNSYRLRARLDTDSTRLSGTVWIKYVNNHSEPLGELRFRLDRNLHSANAMTITEIREALSGRELEWSLLPLSYAKHSSDQGILRVKLSKPLQYAASETLSIKYDYENADALKRSLSVLEDDPYDSLDAWYPKAMSFDGTDWSIDDDRLADYDLNIDLPADMLVASSGKVADKREIEGGQKRIRLQANSIRGFTIYASNQFKEKRSTFGDIELSLYYYEEKEHFAAKILKAAADAIEYMDKAFGPFPTRHLTIYCKKEGAGAFTSCNLIGLELGPKDDWIEKQYRWLLSHEVAHQYVGSCITEPRDTVKWLTVGLGLLMDYQYVIDRGVEHPVFDWLLDLYPQVKKMGFDTTLTQSVSALYTDEDRNWSMMWNLGLQHGKAFNVCLMLADVIGKEKLLDIVREIIKEKAGDLVYYPEVIKLCEEAYGGSLRWFVSDWIEGDATFDYAIAGVHKTGAGWEVEIDQVGSAAFPVLVEAETVSGEKLRSRLDRNLDTNILAFETTEELKSVVIDPVGFCPDLDRTNNTWPVVEKNQKDDQLS